MENLFISDKQEITKGHFNQVHISGGGHFTNDLQCEYLQISGQAKVLGNLTVQEAHISGKLFVQKKIFSSGQFHISGSLICEQKIEMGQLMVSGSVKNSEGIQVEQVHVSGHVKAKDIKAKEISVSGKMMIEDDLITEYLGVSGKCEIKSSVQAEEIKVEGQIKAKDFINAERIRLAPSGRSEFKGMGASEVEIRHLPQNNMGLFSLNKVKGEQIEAERIYVEYARIEKISGRDIVIGPECEIGVVEYTNSVEIHKNSIVGKSKKI